MNVDLLRATPARTRLMNCPTMIFRGVEYPLALTVPETAQLLRTGRDATYAAVDRGDIPSYRVGRTIRVPLLEVLRFLGHEDSQTGPDTNEEPPAGDSSEDLNPAKDRSTHEYPRTTPDPRATPTLHAVT